MRCVCLLVLSLFASAVCTAQTLRFTQPVLGEIGKDVFLVNHVDHDTASDGIRNYACKVYTYDGHDGTDFVIPSFRHMDSGVTVVAAASGKVIAVVDSLYDRNKLSIKENGFGNYIALQHAEGYVSYYAHIRKNSALVRVGQHVASGQPIALVGSSGNSSDPHLHFELWRRVDPFAGQCGDVTSLWSDQHDISGEHAVVDHDITTWPPTLDTLRERPPHVSLVDTTASTITAWSVHNGIDANDVISIAWYMPSGAKWFDYSYTCPTTTNFMYWWSYIDYSRATMPAGTWTAVTSLNGTPVCRDTFTLATVVSVEPNADQPRELVSMSGDYEVYSMSGQHLSLPLHALPDGSYFLRYVQTPEPVQVVVRDGIVFGIGSWSGHRD